MDASDGPAAATGTSDKPLTATTGTDLGAPTSVTEAGDGAVTDVRGRKGRSLLSAGVYSFGFTIQRAIGLVMLPLYTRVISPSQYGALGVLVASAALVYILFSLGLESALMRNYFQLEAEPKRQAQYIDSLWRFVAFYPLVASVVISAAAWPFVSAIKEVSGADVFFMLLSTAAAASTGIPLTVLRARQDLRRYSLVIAVPTLATPALTVLFVVGLRMGILGWFVASTMANVATFAIAAAVVPWHVPARIKRPMLKSALLFSLPLLPHLVSQLALQLADRGVIATIVSSAALGTYTLAANFSAPLMLVVIAVYQGFSPVYGRAGVHGVISDELAQTVVLQVAAVAALTLAGILLGPPVVDILTPSTYHGAASLIPWIMLGYGFLGVYFIPMSGAVLGAGRTRFVWLASGAGACTNIVLLFVFVPGYGIHAAAIASAAGYAVLLGAISVWAHVRDNPVTYRWRPIAATLTAATLTWLGSTTTDSTNHLRTVIINVGWLAAFLLAAGLAVFRAQVVVRARGGIA